MIAQPTAFSTATVSGLDYFYYVYTVEYQNTDVQFK